MKNKLEDAGNSPEFRDFRAATPEELERFAHIETRLFEVRIPEKSWLAGKRISESRLRGGFDLHIIKIARAGVDTLLPDPEETLQGGDILTLHGRKEDLDALKGLQQLDIHVPSEAETRVFESEEVGLLEATLAPRSKLAGRTPAQIEFRAKYGSQLLGILRADRAYRSNLGNMPLEFGDALLIMGPRERLRLLNSDPDFLLLTQFEPKTYKREKAILAAAIMLAVLIPVFLGWFPIAITAITGATLMILLGCLTMEEAYRAIEWKAVFLIAGMLPLGIAMQHSGAAAYLADGVMVTIGGYGPWTVIFGLYFATALATTIIPTAALVVLMAPIVIKACNDMGVSPHAGMMAVAMAASASFTSPISHPANVLVMGPGGYRFIDYIKLGAPLALVVFITVVIVLPIFWPL